MRILGIDPGKTGALVNMEDGKIIETLLMPVNGKELDLGKIAEWIGHIDLGCVEKASAWPGQGVTGMFRFGESYGAIKGILAALDIPTRLVTPQAWKKLVLAGTNRDKDAAIAHVRRVYPEVKLVPDGSRKPHSGLVDAVCISEFGWRVFGR